VGGAGEDSSGIGGSLDGVGGGGGLVVCPVCMVL